MTFVVGVGNQKGGVGKTTLSVNICGHYAAQGKKVLLVDSDVQGSALDWQKVREDEPLFNVVGIPNDSLHREIKTLGAGYDVVVIDSPPHSAQILRSVIMASDRMLVPVTPSAMDVWASAEVVKLIQEAKVFKEDVVASFVINRKIVNTTIGDEVRTALEQFELPLLNTSVGQRVVFAESMSAGYLVSEFDKGSAAHKEIAELVKEIENG